MIKNTTYILLFGVLLTACRPKQPVNRYETRDWFSSNLSLSYKRTYSGERLIIKINNEAIYEAMTDSSLFQGRKMFDIPDSIKTIEIESYYRNEKVLSGNYKNTARFKRISIIVGYPYPKGISSPPRVQRKEWFFLPLDSIKRNVYIEPDTASGQIILEEESNRLKPHSLYNIAWKFIGDMQVEPNFMNYTNKAVDAYPMVPDKEGLQSYFMNNVGQATEGQTQQVINNLYEGNLNSDKDLPNAR